MKRDAQQEAAERAVDLVIAQILRTGVLISILLVVAGIALTFLHHPDYFRSRGALGTVTSAEGNYPSTIREVWDGLRKDRGYAVVALGILVLIATPVARVFTAAILFLRERDWIYVAITVTVLLLLLFSFWFGAAE